MRRILISVFLIVLTLNANAQDDEPQNLLFKYGLYGDLNLNNHVSSFEELPGYPSCCFEYTSASGIGFAVGGLFEMPLMENLNGGVRLGYSQLGAEFAVEEMIGNTQGPDFQLLDNDPNIVDVYSEHHIISNLGAITFEPYILYYIYKGLNVTGGINLGYLLGPTFDTYEELIRPDNVVFMDGTLRRNEAYGQDIPEANNFQLGVALGLGYEIPLTRGISVTPEARYVLGLTDISSVAWKANSLQLGLAIKAPVYEPKELPVIAETVYQRDTVTVNRRGAEEESISLINTKKKTVREEQDDKIIETTTITESYQRIIPQDVQFASELTVYSKDEDGNIKENPVVVIEELEMEESFPLLPYVFFKEGSAELKNTAMELLQKSGRDQFDPDSLPWQTMEIYDDMLNIIAYRMNQNPEAKITVTGTNNNISEKGNLELSRNRAHAVRDYLVDTWNIDAGRITVNYKNLPDNPGSYESPDGIEENQRAEISSTSYEIIQPVNLKEIQRKSNPPVVYIDPEIISDENIKAWNMTISQDGKTLREYNGSAGAEDVVWLIEQDPVPLLEKPVNIKLTAINDLGMRTEAEKEINIQQLTIRKKRVVLKEDKKIEKISLILFDFDKAEITPFHQMILKDIKQRIEPNSEVTIAGYTDRTGEPDYNKKLALRRIEEVQKYLEVPVRNLTMVPVGQEILLYDNDLPQGRSYSRTVQITIETPVE